MNQPLLAAAALTVIVCAVHSILGERLLLIPLLRRDDLPKAFGDADYAKYTLRLVWHVTTVFGLGFAAWLFVLASPSGPSVRTQVEIVVATIALGGIVALVVSRGRHPSWIAFLAIAALAWFGMR